MFSIALWWLASASAAPLTADAAVAYALAHHPDAVAAAGAVEAAAGRRRDVAVFLENPELEAGVAVVGDLVQGQAVQPLSVTGEGWSARRAAGREQDATGADLARARFVLAAQVRAAYVHAVTEDARARLADEALVQAGRLRAALEDRVTAGEASSLDVRLARLAEARTAAVAVEAHREAASARANLAAYHPDALAAELVDPVEVAAPPLADGGERSDLLAARTRVEGARAELSRARASTVPPIGVGAMFQRDGGEWDVGPAVGVEVPIWSRSRADVSQARADLATAEADAASLEARVAAEQAGSTAAAAYAEDLLGRLGDVDADAREAMLSVQRAFEAGDLPVVDAVLLRTEILEGWTAGVDARESRGLARLDALLAVEAPVLLGAP